jgi:transposase InsO family protein
MGTNSHAILRFSHQINDIGKNRLRSGGKFGLKTELISLEDFDTHDHAQTAVFEYIEVFYNRQRCHSANGYLAPLAYEQAWKTNGIVCPAKC